jgi:acyl-CoA thioesterase-2
MKARAAVVDPTPTLHACEELVRDILVVDPDGSDRFVSRLPASGAFDRMYGGHLLAQALLAAAVSVPQDRMVNSLHALYLRLGDMGRPIEYRVSALRDSGSYSTRRVAVHQGDRELAEVTLSFHRGGELMAHQVPPPTVSPPEVLPSRTAALARAFGDAAPVNMGQRLPFEIRHTAAPPWERNPGDPQSALWVRPAGTLPDRDRLIHAAALAYCSDLLMFEQVIAPTPISWTDLVNARGVFGSSLDHTIWFHRPIRFDGWLLHTQECQIAVGARGLATGRYYDGDGALIASVAQEIGVTAADRRH